MFFLIYWLSEGGENCFMIDEPPCITYMNWPDWFTDGKIPEEPYQIIEEEIVTCLECGSQIRMAQFSREDYENMEINQEFVIKHFNWADVDWKDEECWTPEIITEEVEYEIYRVENLYLLFSSISC